MSDAARAQPLAPVPNPVEKPHALPATPRCPNCSAEVTGTFCAECGQKQGPLHVSLWHLFHEFAEDYFHFDSKLLLSLAYLFRPGFLTTEFLQGRRARYLGPFKLYLTASVLFFFCWSFSSEREEGQTDAAKGEKHVEAPAPPPVPKLEGAGLPMTPEPPPPAPAPAPAGKSVKPPPSAPGGALKVPAPPVKAPASPEAPKAAAAGGHSGKGRISISAHFESSSEEKAEKKAVVAKADKTPEKKDEASPADADEDADPDTEQADAEPTDKTDGTEETVATGKKLPPEAKAALAQANAKLAELGKAGVPLPKNLTLSADEATGEVELKMERADGSISRLFRERAKRFKEDPKAAREHLVKELADAVPKAMFALLPFFALLLKMLYRRAERFYPEHFVFALHFHALVFVALLIQLPLRDTGLQTPMNLAIAAYLFFALRKVYGGGVRKTLVKLSLLGGIYGLTVMGTLAAITASVEHGS